MGAKKKKKGKTWKGGSAVIRPDCHPMNVSSVDETSRVAARHPPAPRQSYLQRNTGVLIIRHRKADVCSAAAGAFSRCRRRLVESVFPLSIWVDTSGLQGAACPEQQQPLSLSFISRPSESPALAVVSRPRHKGHAVEERWTCCFAKAVLCDYSDCFRHPPSHLQPD